MLTVRNQYQRHSPETKIDPGSSVPGSGLKPTYSSYYDSHGRLIVEQDGTADLYMEIQSHKDSCDIHVLLDRYRRGDLEVMERLQTQRGVYADVTSMPQTYAEVLNMVHQGEQEFLRLPVDVRAKFDHSYEVYMASMDDPKVWSERMGFDAAADQAQTIETMTPASATTPEVTTVDT